MILPFDEEFAHVGRIPHSDTGDAERVVYLDNAASTQMPLCVVEKVRWASHNKANVHRGDHFLGNEMTAEVESSRTAVAELINAQPENIIFTSGTTQSINMVAAGFSITGVPVFTELEHHANIVPWQMYHTGSICVPMDSSCELPEIYEIISAAPEGSLIALTHVSNVTGTKNNIKTIIAHAHSHGHLVLVDAAQSILTNKIDVVDLDVDFLVFSGHKMYGPTGVGVLYGKPELLERIRPQLGGGDMIEKVYVTHHTLNQLPHRLEAGTPNILGIIGLGEAARFIRKYRETIIIRSDAITRYAMQSLSGLVDIIGPVDGTPRGTLVAFTSSIHPHDMSTVCDKFGVAVRGGSHCAQPLHRKLGISGSVRASFSGYNTLEDVDILVKAIHKAKELFA